MGELRDRMVRLMGVKRYAKRTEEAYLGAVRSLAGHYHRSPDQITREEIREYLSHLVVDRHLAWSSCNQAAAAFRFFYGQVLGWQQIDFYVPAVRKPQRLPEIFSRQEVEALFQAARDCKPRTLLMTAYGAGLRVGELVELKVGDIDSGRMVIRVNQGKGERDRYTLLSPRLLQELRGYWREYRPPAWLFPGAGGRGPLSRGAAQKIFYRARDAAGIRKRAGIHVLRHCFASHLLEAGIDLHTIQTLLGHRSILTTTRYLRLVRPRVGVGQSAFDLLAFPKAE